MAFNKFDHSLEGEFLPRFRLRIAEEKTAIFDKIKEEATIETTVSGTFADNYVILRIPKYERHYWSPELQIQFTRSEENNASILRCVIGPAQSVWLMFTFFYSITILLTVFGGMFGMIQYSVARTSAFLWFWPVGIVLLIVLFAVSKAGQRKARNQTLHLVSFLLHALEKEYKVTRIE